jgi:hypothetical protein
MRRLSNSDSFLGNGGFRGPKDAHPPGLIRAEGRCRVFYPKPACIKIEANYPVSCLSPAVKNTITLNESSINQSMPRIGRSRPLGSDHSTATSPAAAAISPPARSPIPSDLDSPPLPILTRPFPPLHMHASCTACMFRNSCPITSQEKKKTDVKQATLIRCAHASFELFAHAPSISDPKRQGTVQSVDACLSPLTF